MCFIQLLEAELEWWARLIIVAASPQMVGGLMEGFLSQPAAEQSLDLFEAAFFSLWSPERVVFGYVLRMQVLLFFHLGILNIAAFCTFTSQLREEGESCSLASFFCKGACFSATEARWEACLLRFSFPHCSLTWLSGFLQLDIVMGNPYREVMHLMRFPFARGLQEPCSVQVEVLLPYSSTEGLL